MVTGTNDAPVVTGAVTGTAPEDGATSTLNGLANASDVDIGNTLSVTSVGVLPAGVTFDALTNSFTLDPSNTAYQSLAAGVTTTVTVNYSVTDGTASVPTSASWVVTGTNDVATITGPKSGSVTEDGTLTTGGKVTVNDVDTGQAQLNAASVGTKAGTYGTFTIQTDGGWSYLLNNGLPAVQALNSGQTLMDSITVTSQDSTDTETITVTINGTNDGPTFKPVETVLADPNDFDGFTGGKLYTTVSSPEITQNNILRGTSGNDVTINGQSGNDTIYGLAGNDTINGDSDVDTIYGGSGNDIIDGGNHVDTIYGGSGTDTIRGSQDGDIIIGGYGADLLTGDQGGDTFRFLSELDRGDTITDFTSGADKLDLSAIDANTTNGAGNDTFAFGGTTPTANGIWTVASGANTVVYADTDGDVNTVEFYFTLVNTTTPPPVTDYSL